LHHVFSYGNHYRGYFTYNLDTVASPIFPRLPTPHYFLYSTGYHKSSPSFPVLLLRPGFRIRICIRLVARIRIHYRNANLDLDVKTAPTNEKKVQFKNC